jgi:hypothetical protein
VALADQLSVAIHHHGAEGRLASGDRDFCLSERKLHEMSILMLLYPAHLILPFRRSNFFRRPLGVSAG